MRIEALPEHLYEAAVGLWHAASLTRPWNDPYEDLRRAVRGPGSTVLAGVDGDALVATAMVGHDGHRGWVYYLAVDPDRQGAGAGRAMMAACEAWVLAQGVPKLHLMVRTDNPGVLGFYDRVGYRDAGVVVLARRLTG